MWIVIEVKLISLILLVKTDLCLGIGCPTRWFDCENGKCISDLWLCDGDNDCGNLKDEHDCENYSTQSLCLSSQFSCELDGHCIPETWHCDGEKDCDDGSDEVKCDRIRGKCKGFQCRDHRCISSEWRCDGNLDCADGSDEKNCSTDKICTENEFLCSSGSCLNRSLICDGKKDCDDGSDEGQHCGETCNNVSCSQKCEETPSGPQCYCEHGYTLDRTDNKTCKDVDECLQEGFCSHKCVNTLGSFECSCYKGYELVGRSCVATGTSPLLLLSTLRDIRCIRLRSGQYFPIRKAIHKALAVDVDPNSQNMYWSEISNSSSIYTAKLDGSAISIVLSHGLLVPEDIAVDYIANNLYITDSGLQQILACKTEGTMCHVLHYKNVEKPRSIVLDLEEGFVYWSDWGENAVGIYRSGMDGSRRIPLVSKRIAWPNSIAIDHTTKRLYWADTKLNRIEYVSLDRSTRKVILNTTAFHPYSLAVFEDTIYWTDKLTFSLESCNKFTGHNMSLIARENGKDIRSVHVYHPVLVAKAPNPCWSNDCSHMCLISPQTGYRCACPQGFRLSTSGKVCTMKENSDSLFLSEGSSVFYIRPEAVGSHSITELPLSLNSALITGVSYDVKSKFLFVADGNTPAIHSVNTTSLRIRELVISDITFPEDLSFDYASNNLYWIDSSKGTVEVISVENLRRITLLTDLMKPVALATSPSEGLMFIAAIGTQATVTMYNMNGKNKRILKYVQGLPMSLALHPSKDILYWADPREGSISYVNFRSNSTKIVRSRIEGIMSVAASEEYVYWTVRKREINLLKGNTTYIFQLPGHEKGIVNRKVKYIPGGEVKVKSGCRVDNGGCSYICLTSPNGRTCACPTDLTLDKNNMTCVARRCEASDFRCMSNGRCLSADLRCDGKKDCDDGSDEVGCGNRCSGDDFRCKNGRCILKSWLCDHRNDCVDNSDEENCSEATACAKDQFSCSDGECITALWRCDNEPDCGDGSDELNCKDNRCDAESQLRCDHGQCVPISWVCDGAEDCYDGSDERNCSKAKTCSQQEFRCETDGICLDEKMRCDRMMDCDDGSDEKNCSYSPGDCMTGMYKCKDSSCIHSHKVCDGHNDCSESEDEHNCTNKICYPEEILCKPKRTCIPFMWMCDGYPDCPDESDEKDCNEHRRQLPRVPPSALASECDEFFCYITGQCLPWSKVCDGHLDCEDLPDEGGLCQRACSGDNGGCSQICKKTPQGSQCSCLKGYRLLSDNKTCDDINECLESGTCSHFCNNTKGGFKCSCAEGYFLQHDRRFCKADGGPATLVYLLDKRIRGFELVTHTQREYINLKSADMRGMDYDASEEIFYWTEWNDGSINSYSPNTNRQDMIVRTSSKAIYVRYDWIAKNLYYSDENSRIGVCNKEGQFCRILILSSRSTIDSIDVSPTTGHMFWTSWITQSYQYSGLIERAEMDGSNRVAIVSQRTLEPTAVTVDHVLQWIYWADSKLQTLESTDFEGSKRRQIVQHGMHYPFAMTVFEDHVYWADWGYDIIVKCDKFTGKECSRIKERNVKAHVLLIAHKVTQPKGINGRCSNSGCHHLCLLTHSGHVCACGEGLLEKNGLCEPDIPVNTSTLPIQCPKNYCLHAECVVEDGNSVCKCPAGYTGDKCQIVVKAKHSTYDYSWIVFLVFGVTVIEIVALIVLLCCSNKSKKSWRRAFRRRKERCIMCY